MGRLIVGWNRDGGFGAWGGMLFEDHPFLSIDFGISLFTLSSVFVSINLPHDENRPSCVPQALQAASCGFGFVIRYYFAGLVYGAT